MNIWSVWKTRNKRRKRLQCPVSCIVTKAKPSVAERNFVATRFQLVNIQRKRCYRQQLIRVSRRSNKNIWKIKPGFRQLLLATASRHRSSHLAKYLPCSVSVSPCNVCKSTSWLLHGQVVNLWFRRLLSLKKIHWANLFGISWCFYHVNYMRLAAYQSTSSFHMTFLLMMNTVQNQNQTDRQKRVCTCLQ